MPFRRDSLSVILDRIYAQYMSRFKPLERTPRYNLLKVISAVDAGMYHQLLGDLDFLALQLFPDTAEGEYLRAHWSSRITPLYAIAASGEVLITGIADRPVPAGLIFASSSGERYYTEHAYRIGTDGTVVVRVKAQGTGLQTNLTTRQELSVVSAIPAGISSKAHSTGSGIIGGANAETDEEYLVRVLLGLRNANRYGKSGDFAAWAMDASPEVSAAWEYKHFGVLGAVLIQVINGSQLDWVHPVSNLDMIRAYINDIAPPVLFTVRTPEIIDLNPVVSLIPSEDTNMNRAVAINRMKSYLQVNARPGVQITAGSLRTAIIDGITITNATVKLNG
ncbi:MAG: baseplate J/gp47 family protein, partial [Treponema sp.]|nr:baseplate J/gp47 family protein [Treponema sp.]